MGLRHEIVGACLATGLGVAASAASAQENTNCWVNGNYVNCHTSGVTNPYAGNFNAALALSRQTPTVDAAGAINAAMAARAQRAEAQREQEAAEEAQAQANADAARAHEEEDLRKQVGALVAAGDCTEARRVALGSGRFNLADQVNRYCPVPSPAH